MPISFHRRGMSQNKDMMRNGQPLFARVDTIDNRKKEAGTTLGGTGQVKESDDCAVRIANVGRYKATGGHNQQGNGRSRSRRQI